MRANTQRTPFFASRRFAGFTLIELLTVIAIIGILAAILIPTVSSVRKSANENRTKAMFSQWVTAIETYREEYGYYPSFRYSDSTENVFLLGDNRQIQHAFYTTLSGRDLDGSRIRDEDHPNPKGIEFYSFSEGDLEFDDGDDLPQPADAFGNREIVIIMDRNQRGLIRPEDVDSMPMVSSVRTPDVSAAPTLPERGIRQGVLIYSAGVGGNSENEARENLVKSWE